MNTRQEIKLLNIKSLADILQVKEKTLYQWAELKQIPHIKINGCLRFSMEDIKAWVQASKIEPEASYNLVARLEARKGGK